MLGVFKEWDPLKVCVVGQSYPPEFYSWIEQPRIRHMFETLAEKTRTVFDRVVDVLEQHDVNVLQPNLPQVNPKPGEFFAFPPVHPRDDLVMIGNTLYTRDLYWINYYNSVRDQSWHDYSTFQEFNDLAPAWQQQELQQLHHLEREIPYINNYNHCYGHILDKVRNTGTVIKNKVWADGGLVFRLSDRLIFGTDSDNTDYCSEYATEFAGQRISVVNSFGHVDGIFSVICPGLVIVHDDPTNVIDYHSLFPGWEIHRVQQHNTIMSDRHQFLRQHNRGRWWIPGMENDQAVIEYVEEKFASWTGNAIESVFDVNMLVIDRKNVLMCTANDELVTVLHSHGITAHVLDVPYMYFWDGGIHCMTAELGRGIS